MNERPDDDLISAYLDGELSPAETAEVEKLLAESPEARQLLEDFRALGTGLRGLPKLHLGDDFRDRVLRQAERSALAGNAWGEEAVKPAPASGGNDGPGVFRFPRTWQGWKWATLATAAALAIWVFGRDAQQPRQVAIAPAEKESPPPAAVSVQRKSKQGLDERREAPRAEHIDVLQAPPAGPAVELQETSEGLNRADRPVVAADAPVPASAAPLAAGRRSKAGAQPEAPAPAPPDVSPEGRKDADDPATLADSAELKLLPAKAAGGVEAGAALGVDVATPEPETLAIDVVVPQPEAASAALTQAFLRNQIVLEPEHAPGEPPAASLANSVQGGAGLNSSPASADFADQPVQAAAPTAPPVDVAPQNAAVAPPAAEQNGLATTMAAPDASLFSFQLPADQQAQLYYVEATEAQVQQTIADLKAQPQLFYSVLPLAAAPQGQQEPAGAATAAAETPNLADAQPVEEKAVPFAEAGQAADSLGETLESFSAAAKKEGSTELNAATSPAAGADPAAKRGLAELETRGEDRYRAAAPASNAEPLDAAAPANAATDNLAADKEASVDPARDEKSDLGKSQQTRYATPEQSLQRRLLTQQQAQQTGRAYRLNVPQTQRALGRGPSGGAGYGRGRGGQGYGLPGGAAGGGMGGMGGPGLQLQVPTRQTGDAAAQPAQAAASTPEGALAEPPATDPQRTVRAYFYLRQAPTLPAVVEPAPAAQPAPAATAPPAAPGEK